MRTRRRAKIEAGLYTKLTVVGVLYGDVIYAVKALDNIKILKQMFAGLNIVLYYDHTMSEDFLRHAKAVGSVSTRAKAVMMLSQACDVCFF
jgi:hypothetical protein